MKKIIAILALALALTSCGGSGSWKPTGIGTNTPGPKTSPAASVAPPNTEVAPSGPKVEIGAKLGAGAAALSKSGDAIIANADTKLKPNAKTVMIHFDYQCGHCMRFEMVNGPTLSKLAKSGDILLVNVVRSFLDRGQLGFSAQAGVASVCAAKAGKYDDVTATIFSAMNENQGHYPADYFTSQLPKKLGVDGGEFGECLKDPANLKLIQTMESNGAKYVNGTPAVLVNGTQLPLTTEVMQSPDALVKMLGA